MAIFSCRSILVIVALSYLFCVAGPTVLAQDSALEAARGRLPDGRAFRTDAQGNQLVDYVAELELSIETLNRQVGGLQSELETKEKIIEGLRHRSPGLVERDLVGSSRNTIKNAAVVETKMQRLEDAEAELVRMRKELEKVKAEKALEHKARQALLDELSQKKAELQKLQQQAKTQCSSAAARKDTTARKESQPVVSKAKEAPSFVEKISAAEKATAAPAGRPVMPGSDESFQGSEHVNILAALRAQVQTDINRIRGLILQRNSAYAQYRKSASPPVFVPRKAVSRRGLDLATISRELRFSRGAKEVNNLAVDVSEIEAKVSEDLDALKRLMK
jgi:peptidoglycan hydrolase CwlO-like protein